MEPSREAEAPIRIVRPVVVPAQFLVQGPFVSAFVGLFLGFATFVTSNMIAGGHDPIVGPGLVVFSLAFVVTLALFGLKVFSEPGLTSYAIYPNQIEFEEGLLNRQRRTVLLDRIIDVQLSEGLLQQTVGAGTVSLVTQQLVSHGEAKLTNRTFHLSNVPQPVEIYELVRSLAVKGPEARFPMPE